jgi:thiol-disulfide isomerase/thioredoxin
MQFGILGLLIVLLISGGVYYTQNNTTVDEKAAEKTAMEKAAMIKAEIEKDASMKADMMKGEEGVMEQDAMMEKEAIQKNGAVKEYDMMMEGYTARGGTYEAYSPDKIAWATEGKVVLFFRASWCPTCKAVDADIRNKLSNIPKNVTILDVNYDTETALKQKYGVTYQHTFVQVDATGVQIAKWSGSPTLAALIAEVK